MGCGLKDMENLKIRTSKFSSNKKFEIIRNYAPTKIRYKENRIKFPYTGTGAQTGSVGWGHKQLHGGTYNKANHSIQWEKPQTIKTEPLLTKRTVIKTLQIQRT